MGRKQLLSAVSLVLLLAGALGSAPVTQAAPDSVALPQAATSHKPSVFTGSVTRIPATTPILSEEKRKPGEAAGGVLPSMNVGDTAVQPAATTTATAPAPSSSFYGLDFANWGAGWPPDTNGDVGPNHYIQTVNTSIGIFDKATGTRTAAFTFDSFFSSAATGTPCDNSNQGDPVVLYDPQADRWVISDFAWSNINTGPFYQCMAVSKSGDPVNGGWYFYAFQTNSGAYLPDYPKLGVWPDGIYMTANVFAMTGSGSFQYAQAWAFNKDDMYAGRAARSVTFQLPKTIKGVTVFSLLPSNMRTVTGAPPAGSPNYLASIWGSYAVRLWKFHVDWTNTANSSLTGPTDIAVSTFSTPPSTIPAKGGNALDSLGYRVMMQNQYTNQNGVQSIWLPHTVAVNSIASIRWYQINVGTNKVVQQGTFNPDSNHRWIPSLAVDKLGNMAVGYSVSSANMYPSIRYAGRLTSDPLGTLGQGETSLIEGTASQVGTFSDGSVNDRWGDYAAMTIDPVDGCTFWFTTEYYESPQPTTLREDNWKTRIGSFKFPGCQ